jgi:hypothetical protein
MDAPIYNKEQISDRDSEMSGYVSGRSLSSIDSNSYQPNEPTRHII